MGDTHGFLKIKRLKASYRPVCERVIDYRDVTTPRTDHASEAQASRCMDCGTPFCHWACPIGNYIPEWNDLVFRKRWDKAAALLRDTNNLPEITGRLCPALCEYACVLGINDDPVTVRENELSIIEHAFRNGFIKPVRPKHRTGKEVAVIGSGPAGISAADQLNRAGHLVTVIERDEKAGGILRFGIPDFKLEKSIIDRRIELLRREGIKFMTGTEAGKDYPASKLMSRFDAIVLAGGSRAPRDLKIEGRGLGGIYFAMDLLTQSNRRVAGRHFDEGSIIDAKEKRVVVIGGGDTGADCVGTCNRQGASCVTQIEVMPRPPEMRPPQMPWPKYPNILRTSTSHEEGGAREWSIMTKRFVGKAGRLKGIVCSRLDAAMKEIPGSEFEIGADMAVLAIGFLHPEHNGLLDQLRVEFDDRGNVKTGPDHMTSVKRVFAAGDMRKGQSLIVWAISEGRRAAHFVDKFLMGSTELPIV